MFKPSLRLILSATLLCAALTAGAGSARAQSPAEMPSASKGSVVDVISAPAQSEHGLKTADDEANTHPPVRLTPDKSEIITLDRDAGSIIIGNPAHLSIVADSTRRLVLVPRAPGSTFFSVLAHDGSIIMQRHAIVASPKTQYIRIRRACANGGSGCQEMRMYHCPDMCHEIQIGTQGAASYDGATASSGPSSDSGDESNEDTANEDTAAEDNTADTQPATEEDTATEETAEDTETTE